MKTREEKLAYQKEYNMKNRERLNAMKKQYRENPEYKAKEAEYTREHYKKNRETILEKRKENYNPEYQKQYDLEYNKRPERIEYLKNYEETHKEEKKQYYEENKEKIIDRQREYNKRPEVKERNKNFKVNWTLMKKYGITLDDKKQMLIEQNKHLFFII